MVPGFAPIFVAFVMFTANLCASHCDLQDFDPHACCHHKKAPVKVEMSCSTISEKVEVSFTALDIGVAARYQPVLEPAVVVIDPPDPRPPDLPAPSISSLRI